MGRCTALIKDVHDFDAARAKRVANEGTVATPPGGFRAHDGGALLLAKLEKSAKAPDELGRLHVVGIAAERCPATACKR